MALGVAEMLMQAVTRNPLAEPGLLGANAGAAFFMVAGVALFGLNSVAQAVWLALLGALLATLAVQAIGGLARGGPDPWRLTLAGIALAAVLGGTTQGILLLDPQVFETLRGWSAGTLAGRPQDILPVTAPLMLLGLGLAGWVTRPLDALALGEELGAGLGARPRLVRGLALLAVTLLAGGATASAGPIAFVGLMAPHLVRLLGGAGHGRAMVLTLLLAPTLLLAADAAGRLVLAAGEVPVGIMTAFLGAPVLILLSRRKAARS